MDDKELDSLFGVNSLDGTSKDDSAGVADARVDSGTSGRLVPSEEIGLSEDKRTSVRQNWIEKLKESGDSREKYISGHPEASGISRENTHDVADEKTIADSIHEHRRSIVITAVVILVITMAFLVAFLPAFRVRNVTVDGNVVITDDEILNMTGLTYNAHLMRGVSGNIFDILSLNYGKTERRIMAENPYIENIKSSIRIPSTVYIEVTEREKMAYVKTPDGYAAIDRNGIVLELSSGEDSASVRPVICGIQVNGATLGKKISIANTDDFNRAVVVLGAILTADNATVGGDYSLFANTAEVRILPSGFIFLTVYSPSGNKIQVKLKNTEKLNDDMAWLLYAMNANAFDQVTADGTLDRTGDEYISDE